ncbi:hypothetical protein PI124_g22398 [Phytophthora idaei]|nr:hypothetical protein PI125_g24104 [Phytophthora idaei]KAG3127006.1 hypothetical protein PI126_g22073 [Phytophthora idaei]KAG3232521.1 hypothetical protein PI124_g22398 [Phytophthora idaei]
MGQDNVEYGMLDSGDEDAKEDVVSDTESDFDDTASVASGIDGSEPGEDQDAMDHLLAKDFLREFGGSDAVLAGNLNDGALKDFATAGCSRRTGRLCRTTRLSR